MKQRNPIAKSLRSPHLRQQTVPNKKAYSRKAKHKKASPSEFLTLSPAI